MDGILFLVMLLMVISFHLKGYYTYKFFVMEEFKKPDEGLFRFSLKAEHAKHKRNSFGLSPVQHKASTEDSAKARSTANLFLIVFYICITFVVGYLSLVGKYTHP